MEQNVLFPKGLNEVQHVQAVLIFGLSAKSRKFKTVLVGWLSHTGLKWRKTKEPLLSRFGIPD